MFHFMETVMLDINQIKMALVNHENCIFIDEIVVKIIQNIPIAEWSQLEMVSQQFQRCIHKAYLALKTLDLKTVFLAEYGIDLKRGNEEVFKQFFTKLILRCPLLQAISGFDCLLNHLSLRQLDLLSELSEINNVNYEYVSTDINELGNFMKKFPQLKSLKINSNNIKPSIKNDAYFEFFGKFYGLVELTMNYVTNCSGSFLSLVNAENLKLLNLKVSSFNGSYIGALLNRCINLETLKLSDNGNCLKCNTNGYEIEVLQCLPNLTKLHEFDLNISHSGTAFDGDHVITYNADALLNILVKCKNLTQIHLRSTCDIEIFTDDFLRCLISECLHLTTLDFSLKDCSSEDIVSNIQYMVNLTNLVLIDNINHVLHGLCSKLCKLINLSHLVLSDVNEGELMLLNLKNVTTFSCNGEITKAVAKKWIENGFLKKLVCFNIFTLVEDEILKSICENTPKLESLLVLGEISDETLVAIAEHCKYLQKLDIQHCNGVTENGLFKFLSSCCNLSCVNVNFGYDVVSSNVLFKQFKHIIWCNDF